MIFDECRPSSTIVDTKGRERDFRWESGGQNFKVLNMKKGQGATKCLGRDVKVFGAYGKLLKMIDMIGMVAMLVMLASSTTIRSIRPD